MYQIYNLTQLEILRALEDLYKISLLETTLYIYKGSFQYLPIDDYSLRLFSKPIIKSVLSVPDYRYIKVIYPLLRKSSGTDIYEVLDNLKNEVEEARLNIDSLQSIEPNIEFIKEELINRYVPDIYLNSFLQANSELFLDSCYQDYLFDFDISTRCLEFNIETKFNFKLKGNKVKGFNSLLREKGNNTLIAPLILFLDDEIRDMLYLTTLLERVKEVDIPLLTICNAANPEVIDLLIHNNNSSNLVNELFLNTDNTYENLYDIAKISGSRIIKGEEELFRLKLGDLGTCGSVIIKSNEIEFSLNEQNNVPLLIHKRRLESSGVEGPRLDRLTKPTILLSIGGLTDTDKIYRQHLLSKFLLELELIRGEDLLVLPKGLISVFNPGYIYSQLKIDSPLYLGKKYLIELLDSIYESIKRFLLIGNKVKSK